MSYDFETCYELECYSCGVVGEIGDKFRLVTWGRQCVACGSYEVHASDRQRAEMKRRLRSDGRPTYRQQLKQKRSAR